MSRKQLGVYQPAHVNADDAVGTLLDLSCVCHSELSSWILRLSICPIDDGAASLNNRPAVEQDRQAGRFAPQLLAKTIWTPGGQLISS